MSLKCGPCHSSLIISFGTSLPISSDIMRRLIYSLKVREPLSLSIKSLVSRSTLNLTVMSFIIHSITCGYNCQDLLPRFPPRFFPNITPAINYPLLEIPNNRIPNRTTVATDCQGPPLGHRGASPPTTSNGPPCAPPSPYSKILQVIP